MNDLSWLICIGSFGPEDYQDFGSQDLPLIVLNTGRVVCSEDLDGKAGPSAHFFHKQDVYLGDREQEMNFYWYNDQRHNGYLSLSRLQARFPNLRLHSQGCVRTVRFDVLIDEWLLQDHDLANLLAREGGALWLHTTQPQLLIAGMGAWLSRFTDLYWSPRGSIELARMRLEDEFRALESQPYLLPDAETMIVPGTACEALHWGTDRQRLLQDRCRQKDAEITSLRRDVARLEESATHWHCLAEDLAGERDRLVAAGDQLRLESEQLNDQLQSLCCQRDDLQGMLTRLQQQRSAAEERIAEILKLVSADVS